MLRAEAIRVVREAIGTGAASDEQLPGCLVFAVLELPMAWGPEGFKDSDVERQGHVTCVSGENGLVDIRYSRGYTARWLSCITCYNYKSCHFEHERSFRLTPSRWDVYVQRQSHKDRQVHVPALFTPLCNRLGSSRSWRER